MQYASIYKNGKPDYFFIAIDDISEWAFIQPYFLVTDLDHTRKGSIREMNCLVSGKVWYGKQSHGFGYSASADVYGTLLSIINELYSERLSDTAKAELHEINTHNDEQHISAETLSELAKLNAETLDAKYFKK